MLKNAGLTAERLNMILHKSPLFQISFGTAKDSISPEETEKLKMRQLRTFSSLPSIAKAMRIEDIFFLHQIHSNVGIAATIENQADSFAHEGDFIITDVPELGIGVLTADCLPIVFYDTKNHVAGIAHAGWRGSVAEVGVQTVGALRDRFGTHIDHVQIFLGPSAKVCCYKVNEALIEQLDNFAFANQVVVQHEDGIFFNLPKFNQLQLEALGIKKDAFHVQYNVCTICQDQYYSYRRQGVHAGRQATVISLK